MPRTAALLKSDTLASPASPFVTADEDFIRKNRMISIDAVLAVVPTTRQTLYRWMEAGKFPKPVKLGNSKIGFRETDVLAWLNERPRALGSDAPSPRNS